MQISNFRSDSNLFRLAYGAMGLGGVFGERDEGELIRSVHTAWEEGVNFIDTARAYGRSEEIIGKALKQWAGPKPFIATKALAAAAPAGAYPGMGWQYPLPLETTYPKGAIRRSAEESLRNLGVETIDLLQMHQYWAWDASDYWMEELLRLKEEGKIRYIGISVPDHRHELAFHLIPTGLIDSIQTIINIFDSQAFDCLVPLCQKHGVAVIARCIMDEAGLAGVIRTETTFDVSDYRHRYFDAVPREWYIAKVDRLRPFIPDYAISLADLAIRFVLSHPGVTVALASLQSLKHAKANIESAKRPPLPADVFNRLLYRHRWIKNFYQERRATQRIEANGNV
ncbi:aldo/keto reductase [Paenibacillus hamazuiensis]|uniref:aldo/keto reductase n=1 Tax=Paenibacillus hamazuiensis TaxID=2936508 RepID=UPI00200D927D|nr:aldo/keto reductase [Paenibacillus hamazuiensis]